jgi:amino acid transporter
MTTSMRTGDARSTADDDADLERFGYSQKLNRTVGAFTSFCVSFSMISITTAIFTLFSNPFQEIGGVGIWLWVPATLGGLVIAAVYGHLSARVPVTGYAYQWSSRLLNPHVGWFTGWFALCAFFVGTASIAVALGSVFADVFFKSPTHGDVVLIGAVAVVVGVAINAAGVRRATLINNLGATTEFVGTLGIGAVIAVGLIFFKHEAGPSILFNSKPVGGGSITITTLGLAALLPVTTLLGWEGAADIAEETKEPRKTAPKAMLRAVAISGMAGIVLFAVFAMAIPHGPSTLINQPENPLFYLFQTRLGAGFADVTKVIVFVAIFACLLANLTVATRMCYSLSRDRMLPGHAIFAKVNHGTKVPLYALLLVGGVAFGLQFVSAGIAAKIFAITAVMYYGTYLMTMVVVQLAKRRGTLGDAPAGHFSLGGALTPLTAIGVLWCLIVIGYMTIPAVNHVAAEYAGGAIVLGILQWVFVLRRRIATGESGPPAATAASLLTAEHGAPSSALEAGVAAAD